MIQKYNVQKMSISARDFKVSQQDNNLSTLF